MASAKWRRGGRQRTDQGQLNGRLLQGNGEERSRCPGCDWLMAIAGRLERWAPSLGTQLRQVGDLLPLRGGRRLGVRLPPGAFWLKAANTQNIRRTAAPAPRPGMLIFRPAGHRTRFVLNGGRN